MTAGSAKFIERHRVLLSYYATDLAPNLQLYSTAGRTKKMQYGKNTQHIHYKDIHKARRWTLTPRHQRGCLYHLNGLL